MKKIEITRVSGTIAEYVKRMGKEPIIVTIDGRPVAALLNIGNVDWEMADLRALPVFVADLEAIESKLRANKSIPDQVERMLLGVPIRGFEYDELFASLIVDEDEMVGVASTTIRNNNEVETPKEEEVANAS